MPIAVTVEPRPYGEDGAQAGAPVASPKRVDSIRHAIECGSYRIDSLRVADALIVHLCRP